MSKAKRRTIRLRYHKGDDRYPEGFFLEMFCPENGGSWGLMVFAECHRCAEDAPDAEKNFVHFSIMRELARCMELGVYDFYYTDHE